MKKYIISALFVFCNMFVIAQNLHIDKGWKYEFGNNDDYVKYEHDDSKWKVKNGKLFWSAKELKDKGGLIWLRAKVIIPSSLKIGFIRTGALSISLGAVRRFDRVYINGKMIGKTTDEGMPRTYLLFEDDIAWDKENVIAIRLRHYGDGSYIEHFPVIEVAVPENIISLDSSIKDADITQQVGNKNLTYQLLVTNKSEKGVKAIVKAEFYDFNRHKQMVKKQTIMLKKGVNSVNFAYCSPSDFLNIHYSLSIPEYKYKKRWNAEYGYDKVIYHSVSPIVKMKVKEYYEPADLSMQLVAGWLGTRMNVNLEKRLHQVDEKALLSGFINHPGAHPWIGEHIGKFLDAACYAYKYSKDSLLKSQMDRSVQQLIAAQLEDGYLGTYIEKDRWTSWDVWSHKYNLIGLISYYQLSGFEPALRSAEKIGMLLCTTFGKGEKQRNIAEAGLHVGMAATSVLEPMTDLYRFTGNKIFLDFCDYIIGSYNEKNGPKIISTLTSLSRVDKTANAKAYEMLSNLVGIIKLYKLTNDEHYLNPVLNAWNDIVKNRLYITGTTSSFEHFKDNHLLPAEKKDNMGEGCVTTTWTQLNYHLFCIFGEMKYLDEIERSVYNHLIGAENPQTGCVSYYTPLMGTKGYSCGISCCASSIPRGIAMIPLFTNGKIAGSPSFLFYQAGIYRTSVTNNQYLTFYTKTSFPLDGNVSINIATSRPVSCKIFLRKPYWASDFKVMVNGEVIDTAIDKNFIAIQRTWRQNDEIKVYFRLPVKILEGGISYPERIALQRGPQVLAYDESLNGTNTKIKFFDKNINMKLDTAVLPPKWVGNQAYKVEILGEKSFLVPYADAGQTGGNISTWLMK